MMFFVCIAGLQRAAGRVHLTNPAINLANSAVCTTFDGHISMRQALCKMLLICKNTKKQRKVLILGTIIKHIFKAALPFVLGICILWWMYRDTNWNDFTDYVVHRMNWWWMALSLVFGVLAQQVRAWRWKLALAPLGEHPRRRVCENAIFLSYASSLFIPRIGEVARCGTLKKYDGVPFAKALGTVVTERFIDCLVILLLTACAFLSQLADVLHFLKQTGTDFGSSFVRYTGTGYIVAAVCIVAVVLSVFVAFRRFSIFSRGKNAVRNLWAGITSLRGVNNFPLYIFFSLAVWGCYFLHFYTAFFCFDFTSTIGPAQAFLIFCIGTFAVLVPTPNGAGPWHFAVKTMLVLYGVAEAPAIMFALVVHTIQTFEVVLLGAFAWVDLSYRKQHK